ncbi:M1 family metallopeptidase [Alteromonas oceani]|uniref:Aminopeptidase n=1 Tax=Alteromonas oceani TaxID=2071609 RepID=A0ABV7K5N3_9ALTE|nr:M1 family metallopeptidase [Alteromonas oceani]
MLKSGVIYIVLLIFFSVSTVAASNNIPPPAGKLDDTATPLHYQIHLTIDPDADDFQGKTQITVKLNRDTDMLWLHGKDLDVTSVSLTTAGGEKIPVSYEQVLDSGVAKVTFPQTLQSGEVTLSFVYTAEYSPRGALFKMLGNEQNYIVSQFQTILAREVFPGFDEPRFKSTYQVNLTTPKELAAITNTPLATTTRVDEEWVNHDFKQSLPMPTYLLAFMVGPFDIADYGTLPVNNIRERPLPLRALVTKGKRANVQYALDNTQAILDWLEDYFGSQYPYQKLDLIAPPGSLGFAMENPGAVLYDQYLLLLDENSPAEQKRAYTLVHSHELAHMWFGNLVTPEWWDDLWLNESFATWMAYKASHAYWPAGEFDRGITKMALRAMNNDALSDTQSVKQPVSRNEDIAYALDGEITYAKGAAILTMMERYIGAEQFQKGIRHHMQRFAHGGAHSDDFIASLASVSNQNDLTSIFNDFIRLPGVPLISASLDCSEEGKPKVQLHQSRYAAIGTKFTDKQQWTVPVCVAHGSGETCHVMKQTKERVPLKTNRCPAFIHPNAQSGYYRFSLNQDDWQHLIRHGKALPSEQALTMLDSLDAGLRAGHIDANIWLEGMLTMARHPAWDVIAHTKRKFEGLANSALSGDALDTAAAISRAIFTPIYDRVNQQTSVGAQILSSELQSHLLEFAKLPEMRAPLREQAQAFVGIDGVPDFTAIPAAQRATALTVAVRDLGESFFTVLEQRFAESDDPALSVAMIRGLSRTTDPELGRRLLERSIGGIYDDYAPDILREQLSQAETQDSTFRWLKNNTQRILDRIPDNLRGAAFPPLAGELCSMNKADDWEKFIVSRAEQLPGYERSLGQTLEKIRRCARLKDAVSGPLSMAIQEAIAI